MSNPRYPEEFKIQAVNQVIEKQLPVADVAARLGVPTRSLYAWIKRYSKPQEERQQQARYFTLLPLTTELMGGPAQVPTYDPNTLSPTYTSKTFSDVDVDAWARIFLSAFDEILAPASCAEFAAFDSDDYQSLMGLKAVFAKALANGVGPVFPSTTGGNLAAAQDLFEQSVLTSLSTAYAMKLPITASTTSSPGLLNFLVTAARAGGEANQDLELPYSARVEHHFNDSESAFGYTPSQWLGFVLEHKDDPLTLSLGVINVPVPVRAFPASPVLQTQHAEQTAPAPSDALGPPEPRWNYSTRLVLPEHEAQDELWVRLTYNQPLSSTLLDAFELKSDSPPPHQVIKALLDQISRVTSAWAAWPGHPGLVARTAVRNDAPAGQTSTGYVLNFSNAFDEQPTLQLFAQGEYVSGQCDKVNIVWPIINGQIHGPLSPAGLDAPTSGACWFVASYDYAQLPDAVAGSLEFVWPSLDVATRQTAISRWWIVRNANLGGASGLKTNRGLIYQTPDVSFASPVVPLITMPRYTFAASDSLADTIERALSPFAQAASSAAKERLLQISIVYSVESAAPAGGGAGLWIDLPILMANNVQLASDDALAATENALTLHDLACQLATECERWFKVEMPSTGNAVLSLDVTLFTNVDGSQAPIVCAPQLLIRVPHGGWQPR